MNSAFMIGSGVLYTVFALTTVSLAREPIPILFVGWGALIAALFVDARLV